MAKQLLEPVFEHGLLETNFLNGGLLTAEMLQTEQRANRTRHQQLGRAIGAGVAFGYNLRVTNNSPGAPEVEITPGMALSHSGHLVVLPETVTVVLAREPATFDPQSGIFTDCEIQLPPATATVDGIFILTAISVTGFKGKVPLHGFNPCAGIEGCGSRYIANGIAFRLVPYPASALPSGTAQTLRSRIAFGAFGVDVMTSIGQDPFAQPDSYGVLDAMQIEGSITECDVPLGLVRWSTAGIEFIDSWAVRRPLMSTVSGLPYPHHAEHRRLAESQAMFLQFQQSVVELLGAATTFPVSYTAAARLRYLPPAGYLPTGPAGFNAAAFFGGFDVERVTANEGYLRLLVQQSFYMEPIDLAAGEPRPPLLLYESTGDVNWVLFVRADRATLQPTVTVEETPVSNARGTIDIGVALTDAGEALQSGRPTLGKKTGDRGTFRVWAVDKIGNQYDAKPVKIQPGFNQLAGKSEAVEFDRSGRAVFRIANLRSGEYMVHAALVNYRDANQAVTLEPAESRQVSFKLVPASPKGGRTLPPRDPGDVTWVDERWYKYAFVIEELIDYPWPPERWGPDDFTVGQPPEQIRDWYLTWSDRVRELHPNAPVSPGDISVAINRSHTPEDIANEPYAYIVFGNGGAYAPIVLTANDRTFDHNVPVERGDVPSIDRGLEYQLFSAGLGRLDAAGAAWTGLFTEFSGIGPDAAREIISDTRGAIDTITGTVREFAGVRGDVESVLREASINTPVDLANQTLDQLVDLGIDRSLASRLIDEARTSVPSSAWSIESLGLTGRTTNALSRRGIDTLGAFKNTMDNASAEEVQRLAGDTGITASGLQELSGSINLETLTTSITTERIESAPVIRVTGVDRSIAETLAKANITRVADLRGASAEDLAATLGGNQALAGRLIDAAGRYGAR